MQAVFSLATVVLFVVNSYYWDSSYLEVSLNVEVSAGALSKFRLRMGVEKFHAQSSFPTCRRCVPRKMEAVRG